MSKVRTYFWLKEFHYWRPWSDLQIEFFDTGSMCDILLSSTWLIEITQKDWMTEVWRRLFSVFNYLHIFKWISNTLGLFQKILCPPTPGRHLKSIIYGWWGFKLLFYNENAQISLINFYGWWGYSIFLEQPLT